MIIIIAHVFLCPFSSLGSIVHQQSPFAAFHVSYYYCHENITTLQVVSGRLWAICSMYITSKSRLSDLLKWVSSSFMPVTRAGKNLEFYPTHHFSNNSQLYPPILQFSLQFPTPCQPLTFSRSSAQWILR